MNTRYRTSRNAVWLWLFCFLVAIICGSVLAAGEGQSAGSIRHAFEADKWQMIAESNGSHHVYYPGTQKLTEPESPVLPVRSTLIELPEGEEIVIENIHVTYNMTKRHPAGHLR